MQVRHEKTKKKSSFYICTYRRLILLLEKYQIDSESIDWLLLHQANQRILDAVASRFSIPSEQVLSNLKHYGNTSAATIPLMLDEAVRDQRIKSGDLIACSGFGAGLSWGAALFYWHGPH